MSIAELQKLPPIEKLKMIETLWSDLVADEESVPSPSWHENALRETERELAEGHVAIVPWEAARKDLRNRFE